MNLEHRIIRVASRLIGCPVAEARREFACLFEGDLIGGGQYESVKIIVDYRNRNAVFQVRGCDPDSRGFFGSDVLLWH
jgi:hypothetical protein